MQKTRRRPRLRPLVDSRFQVLFHSFFRVLFTFPSRYLFTIGLSTYLALPDGSGRFTEFHMFRATQDTVHLISTCIRGYHPPGQLSRWFCRLRIGSCPSYNPNNAETMLVWANPVRSPLLRESLIVFFSSGYLDVSVLRVCSFR